MQLSCTVEFMGGSGNGKAEPKQHGRVYRQEQVPILAHLYPLHRDGSVWVTLKQIDGTKREVEFSLVTGEPMNRIANLTVDMWRSDMLLVRLSPRSRKNLVKSLPLQGQKNFFDDHEVGDEVVVVEVGDDLLYW